MSGVIAAGGSETAHAGAKILQQGGNAVDAAVAAAFVSFIAEIGVVHLGGSGIAHIYDPQTGESLVYDFFSDMPGRGRDEKPSPMDFERVTIDFGPTTQDFYLGRASVAVPGNVAGLCRMAADHGRLPLPQLLQPAIDLARSGLPINKFQADTCDLLTPLYTHTDGMSAIFAKNGGIIQPEDHLFIPDLADTLEALAAEGEALARHGRLAHAILADQAANGGLLTAADLAEYEVRRLPSIRIPYHEYEILLPPPSSTGGVLIAFTLKLLNRFRISQCTHNGVRHLQLFYEVMTATTRARVHWEHFADSLPRQEAIDHFLDPDFIQPTYEQIQDNLESRNPTPPAAEAKGPNHTSHLSVIDSDGLAVSLTTTAGESAGYIVPGTGYIPNNMLGEEDLHPGGFHTRPAGQRIPTMMSPVIVLQDGQTRMVTGSGGSIRIRSALVQVLSNLLDFRMTLDEAVNINRVHVEDGVLQCEAGYDPTAVDELETMGYPVNRWQSRSIYFGGAHTVSRTPDGRLVAAGDNRRSGYTAVA